ncbi:ABC transporter permease [Streptomyces sp. DT24]|uniref:ABC transporter permease n=1 Tax=unclassified Streptomyces TaxID=2593676 RepID=UPI0023B8E140|nr:ABC transporter permease [Streptomyces sp. AM 4-1-1]WEH37178.1 ABC transporter permease [Streptomyces sp. AM 4-1-1]
MNSRWLLRRLAQMVLVLLGVITLSFFITYAVPGDPARLIAGPNADAATVASIHTQLGLDASMPSQYVSYLGRLLHGDLGTSYAMQGTPVAEKIAAALPVTAMVAVGGIVWQLVIGVPVGVVSAYRPKSPLDRLVTLGSLLGLSAPPFWLGLLLIYYLSFKLSLFPLSGLGSPMWWYLVLPTFTLGFGGAAWYARMTRTTMIDVLRSPYIQMARAKGMPERKVLLRHGLRHAFIPLITMIGMDFGYFLGGVLIIESVFGLPGAGKLTYDAIDQLDIPMITGTVVFAAFFIVVMNLLVDIAYHAIDPRVRARG